MAEVALKNGVELYLEHPVTAIRPVEGGYVLTTPRGTFETKTVINAAGVHADQVERLAAEPGYAIHPVRGEYWLLDKSEGTRVRHVVFQCPNEQGKGVLVAPTVHGNLIVGPNADPVEDREDVSCSARGLAFVREKARLSVPGVRFGENIRNFAGLRDVYKRQLLERWCSRGMREEDAERYEKCLARILSGEMLEAYLHGSSG